MHPLYQARRGILEDIGDEELWEDERERVGEEMERAAAAGQLSPPPVRDIDMAVVMVMVMIRARVDSGIERRHDAALAAAGRGWGQGREWG